MTDRLRIALAQLNPTVGALEGNLALGKAALADAAAAGADILLLPELFLTGYFPEDLLFKPQFVADAIAAAHRLAAATRDTRISMLLPSVWRQDERLFNAVLLAEQGEVVEVRYKYELPNDDVFFEKRYFTPGPLPVPVTIRGVQVGVPICEDIWHADVCAHLVTKGAEILLCPNGSPYWRNKQAVRQKLVRARVREDRVPMLYLNQVGGQDELVYDGASFAIEPGDRLVLQGRSWESELVLSNWERTAAGWRCSDPHVADLTSVDETPWRACVLGLRDYVTKNGFRGVLLGLSGGIDSAVVAAMAVDALGADRVHCVMLPYRYTSEESLEDARLCAQRLGVRYDVVSIGDPVEAALADLIPLFGNRPPDVTEENIQSRMRGVYLMALSNKLGALLLTTGNKSELAVGYATIYGDMNGGFNPIKDLLKTRVYELAAWRNAHQPGDCLGPSGEVIPASIIAKTPSAELRPNQTDQDSLPPYPILDEILTGLVEEERSVREVVAHGEGRFDHELVERIERLVYLSEYKRRQAAPGVKVSRKAFGSGRKYPITNGYRDHSGRHPGAPSAPGLDRHGVQ